MKLEQLIEKWKINQSFLAKSLSITQGAFNQKLRRKDNQYFTKEQEDKIKEVIRELGEDINSVSF
jgi:predicted XRE-type DNA-binding protein